MVQGTEAIMEGAELVVRSSLLSILNIFKH
jgi:hypothetical protein